jgi:mono/diheme cytochrome c family protein
MTRAISLAVVAALLFSVAPLGAQETRREPKDVRDGRAFAQRVCAVCHGIRPGEISAVAGAPNFAVIANTPGMSPVALRVALERTHREMPNFAFTADEIRIVRAYILSLQERRTR